MPSIIGIEGIGPQYAKTLSEIGIKTTEALLKQGATPKGRIIIEERTQIGHRLILEWVNLADLFRIKGIGEEYSDLLEEAGVYSVVELSKRNVENLFAKVNEVNKEKKLARRTPALSMIQSWVEQAKKLDRVIEY